MPFYEIYWIQLSLYAPYFLIGMAMLGFFWEMGPFGKLGRTNAAAISVPRWKRAASFSFGKVNDSLAFGMVIGLALLAVGRLDSGAAMEASWWQQAAGVVMAALLIKGIVVKNLLPWIGKKKKGACCE